jgi:hypothetical protein
VSQRLSNSALTTLASKTVGDCKPYEIHALVDFLKRVPAARAKDSANGTGESTISTLISNLNGLNP